MENIKGRSKERRRARRERRDRRTSNISDVLGMTPMRGHDGNLAEAAALQRAEAAAVHRHGNTPRPMSRMSWYASQAHLMPSPHASAMDWTLEVDEVVTDSDADDESDFAEDVAEEKEEASWDDDEEKTEDEAEPRRQSPKLLND